MRSVSLFWVKTAKVFVFIEFVPKMIVEILFCVQNILSVVARYLRKLFKLFWGSQPNCQKQKKTVFVHSIIDFLLTSEKTKVAEFFEQRIRRNQSASEKVSNDLHTNTESVALYKCNVPS